MRRKEKAEKKKKKSRPGDAFILAGRGAVAPWHWMIQKRWVPAPLSLLPPTTTTKPTFFYPINLTQIEAKGWRRLSNEIPQSSTLGEKQHPSPPTQTRVSMHCWLTAAGWLRFPGLWSHWSCWNIHNIYQLIFRILQHSAVAILQRIPSIVSPPPCLPCC